MKIKKKKVVRSLFLNKGGKKSQTISWNTSPPAWLQGVTFPNLPRQEPQSEQKSTTLNFNAQATFLPGALNPYSEEFFQHVSKRILYFGFPQTQQGALGKQHL